MFFVISDEIDSRSISDQEKIKKHWEEQLASPDARLFPSQPETKQKKHFRQEDDGDFISNVDSDSIADLSATRRRWEIKVAEYEKDKPVTSPPPEPQKPTEADLAYESNIDKEIRLAIEREKKLREEQRIRTYGINRHLSDKNKYNEEEKVVEVEKEMPIHKIPQIPPQVKPVVNKAPSDEFYEKQTYNEMTEADRGAPQVMTYHEEVRYTQDDEVDGYDQQEAPPGGESIIEREIREQMEREEKYRRESSSLMSPKYVNKVRLGENC